MGNQSSSDAVLGVVQADRGSLRFRLGIQIRRPEQSDPAPLPFRYVRMQVASPPPDRIDDTPWHLGLQVGDGKTGSPYDRQKPPPKGSRVFPVHGLAPLGQPRPGTVVLDRWLAVPAVPRTAALTRTFDMREAPEPHDAILSVPYPQPMVDDKVLDVAGVAYYLQDDIDFDRQAEDPWIAISLDRFWPPERASADLLVAVAPAAGRTSRVQIAATRAPWPPPITAAW